MTLENRRKKLKQKLHTPKDIKKFVYRTHLTPYSHHKQSTTDLHNKGMGIYAYAIKNNGEKLI